MLQNMLLEYDGLDSCWNEEENWVSAADDDEDISYALQRARARERMRLGLPSSGNTAVDTNPTVGDFSFVAGPGGAFDATEVEESCHELQSRLVQNFKHVKRTVGWARRRK